MKIRYENLGDLEMQRPQKLKEKFSTHNQTTVIDTRN